MGVILSEAVRALANCESKDLRLRLQLLLLLLLLLLLQPSTPAKPASSRPKRSEVEGPPHFAFAFAVVCFSHHPEAAHIIRIGGTPPKAPK
jgi:hypothetical protein